jgi:dTDP-glucose pyrophosphorylase/CBS domain-containing protein
VELLTRYLVSPADSVRAVTASIDAASTGLVLVVDRNRRLLGTVSDGDVRRAILEGFDFERPVADLLTRKIERGHGGPVTAPVGTPDQELLALMNQHAIRHIPLVDPAGRVVSVAALGDLVKEYELPLRAVVMAGGYGRRLLPLTASVPKPMLPVGERPLLERIVQQLQRAGIRRVNLATHYQSDVIEQHFGDGSRFAVDIAYVNEHEPLGTAGALRLLAASTEPILVINGDILTRVDFSAMLDFHCAHHADMTVAVRAHDIVLPYGVVQTQGVEVVGVSEKPSVTCLINAGIYLLNADVCALVPTDRPYHMTDLIGRAIAGGRRVISFPVREYWRDIGDGDDYERAIEDVEKGNA